MGDQADYKIRVGTEYDGSGMAEARADKERTAAEMASAPAQVDFGRLSAESAAAEKAMAGSAAEMATAETAKTMELEKQLVVATKKAMLEAEIAGDVGELAKLRAELAVRQLTIQTLQTTAMSQAEINALLAEQSILIEQAAVATVVKAEADAAAAGALGFRELREAARISTNRHALDRARD